MCGSRIWTIVAFGSCAYFARVAFARLHSGNMNWSHNGWDIVTHLVWMAFLAGLLAETRCWKERAFFALALLNFGLAATMGIWVGAASGLVAQSRLISAVAWTLAAIVSLLMFAPAGKIRASEKTE
jgi:hypothetical protein